MRSHNVKKIEGIGAGHAKKLNKANVVTVSSLLKKGATRKGRNELSKETKVDANVILKWVNMADLFRVKGIGEEYSELLEKAGVDTVKELKTRNIKNLHAKMKAVNSKGKGLVRVLPGEKRVEGWIKEAKKLKPVIKY
ncbi:DUF4332 domain-containing protein [Bacteroidota bacterium]